MKGLKVYNIGAVEQRQYVFNMKFEVNFPMKLDETSKKKTNWGWKFCISLGMSYY